MTLDFPDGLASPGPLQLLGAAAPTDAGDAARFRLSRALQRVRLRLTTPRGSCPLDRTFGLDPSVLDAPVSRVVALRHAVAAALADDPDLRLLAVHVGDVGAGRLGAVPVRLELAVRA